MSTLPAVVRTVTELRAFISDQRNLGHSIGLVPTMGALHHGHLSLVDVISQHVDTPIVSIFVNPTQFGEGEDFSEYPRTEQADLEKLATTNTALVYAPSVEEMYPNGDVTTVTVDQITEMFEGTERPGHFAGVATVVSKLLLQCMPNVAIFGEKDFQQLAVIKRFVKDLHIPVNVIGGPIIREADGLAASSRNVYLNATERKTAGQLNVILKNMIKSVRDGEPIKQAENKTTQQLLDAGFSSVDYVSVVEPETLKPMEELAMPARLVAVARIGKVRLLDNMPIE
ncbi:pantoate--beta-alanine ligase [Kordiimonas aquimaris]|uniref:pantoate--beta-alanine ligase n=1 Tax=Kordiimonas aquimaris TaxID=707591 RepID=UPI0021D35F38|nr:pantoate--beta-alanine ligase [Kordiimonas aquimaris]